MTSQRLRGLDIDWEEKLEVVNAFRIKRRGENAGVLAHIYMMVERCPVKG
jgi:hypothetical protein